MKCNKKKFKKMIAVLLAVSLLLGIFILPASATSSSPGSRVNSYLDLNYGDGKGQSHKYDLLVPESAYSQNNVPLILYIHGGGFNEGDKSDKDNATFYQPYLDRGYVVANVNYTLVNEQNPGQGIQDINKELFLAMKSIAQKLKELDLNCTQMATLGYSAGGCLAMLYAYSHAKDSPIPVKFVVEGSGPADFTPSVWENQSELAKKVSNRGTPEDQIAWASGGKIDPKTASKKEIRKMADEISPAAYVNSETVPTCMLYGEQDLLVPPASKDRLIKNFDRYGVKYDLISCAYAGHLVYILPKYQKAWEDKAMEYCDWYFVKPSERDVPGERGKLDGVSAMLTKTVYGIQNLTNTRRYAVNEEYNEHLHPKAPVEMKYAKDGPYEVSHFKQDCENSRIGDYRIYYPSEMEKSNKKYPAIIMVNGTGMSVDTYLPILQHLASWGFVVIGCEDVESWDGWSGHMCLQYILKENKTQGSRLYGHIDTEHIGISGHSQGGVAAINAATNFSDSYYYKAVSSESCVSQGLSEGLEWPYDASKLNAPVIFFCGDGPIEREAIAPLDSVKYNYESVESGKLTAMARRVNAEHGNVLTDVEGYRTAWFCYLLKGDKTAGKAFIGKNAELLKNANFSAANIKNN